MAKKDRRTLEEKVFDLVVAQLYGIDEQGQRRAEIHSNSNLVTDLGADSLDLVELVMAVEDEFEVEIPDADAEKIVTVGDIILWLRRHDTSTATKTTPQAKVQEKSIVTFIRSQGVELVAAKRRRQVEEEGWTTAHDAKHVDESLARVAAYYAVPRGRELCIAWPSTWSRKWAKKNPDDRVGGFTRIRELVIAGALIAAEIDRRLAAGEEG